MSDGRLRLQAPRERTYTRLIADVVTGGLPTVRTQWPAHAVLETRTPWADQIVSVSKPVTLRASALNSIPTRWIGSPRPR